MSNKPRLVNVFIERLHDWYIATSPEVHGLCMANPDLALVIKDIPTSIALLFKINVGVEVSVKEIDPGSKDISRMAYTAEIVA